LICLLLGAIVYNSSEIIGELPSQGATFLDTDYLGAALFIGSVVPLLVGLSLAGGLYEWTDWRVLSAIALGSVISLLFIGRELFPSSPWLPGNRTKASPKPLLRLKSLYTKHTVVTFTGAIILGFMVRIVDSFQ
jgi:MFS family permease